METEMAVLQGAVAQEEVEEAVVVEVLLEEAALAVLPGMVDLRGMEAHPEMAHLAAAEVPAQLLLRRC
jgi:hypothetical protein